MTKAELAQQEWDDYQEHLKIGGKALHFRSIFGLGYDAGHKARESRDIAQIAEMCNEVVRLRAVLEKISSAEYEGCARADAKKDMAKAALAPRAHDGEKL